jgi:hypothetical protein
MLQSLLKANVKEAVAQYTARHMEDLVEDQLTMADWTILEELASILQKFYLATKICESRQSTLEDVLPVIDYLLNTSSNALDTAESVYNQVLATMLKFGWETLNQYYSLTDRSPVYIAAVILHPVHKWEYFRKHWKQKCIPNAQQRMQLHGGLNSASVSSIQICTIWHWIYSLFLQCLQSQNDCFQNPRK